MLNIEQQIHFQTQLLSQVNDAVIAIDNENRVIYWNRAAEQLYGVLTCDAIGQPLSASYKHFWMSANAEQLALRTLDETGCWRGENIHQKQNGEELIVESTVSILRDDAGTHIGLIAVIRDISERKREEADRKAAEAVLRQYERVVSATPDGMALVDRTYTYRLVNQTYQQWHQKSQAEIVGHTVSELLSEAVFQRTVKPRFDRCLAGEAICYEEWFNFSDGQRRFIGATYVPYIKQDGTISGVAVTIRDLTSLKQAETALTERESVLRELYQVTSNSHLGFQQKLQQLLAVGCRYFQFNQSLISVLEGEACRVIATHSCNSELGEGFVYQLAQSFCGEALQADEPFSIQHASASEWQNHPGYTIFHCETYIGAKIQVKNLPYAVLCFYSMIPSQRIIQPADKEIIKLMAQWIGGEIERQHAVTDLHQLNNELEQRVQERTAELQTSRDLFEAVFQESADAIFLSDRVSLLILDCNQRAVKLFEAKSKSELMGIQGHTLRREPLSAVELAKVDQELGKEGIWSQEIEYRTLNDRYFWGNLAFKRIQVAELQMNLVRITDISDRKQVEQALEHQLQREQLIHVISQQIRQSLNLNEILATTVTEVRRVLRADRVVVFRLAPDGSGEVIQESVAADLPITTDIAFPNKALPDDDYAFYCEGNARIISDATQEQWSECLSELMQHLGVKSKIVAPIIQSAGYCEPPPDGEHQNSLWGLLIAHACFHQREWLSSELDLLQQLATQVGIAIQQASLYSQLKNQLAQKEVLLTEIHHRVKNNLQVISSMLWLQTKASKHLTVSDALADTRNRIQAMALIHETLYQSGDLGKLNFHDYIQRLASSILSAHGTRSNRIQLIYHLQPVTLNLETAIPCGLLLNELITNAIKHAFPDEQNGEVCIMLEQLPQAIPPSSTPVSALQDHPISRNQEFQSVPRYVLTVQDNGIGIPDDLDLKNLKSLGLKITYDLALQLRGTLELERINGTRFRLFFSPLEYRKRF